MCSDTSLLHPLEFGTLISRRLDRWAPVPKSFAKRLDHAVLQLLDGEILVRDQMQSFRALVDPIRHVPIPEFQVLRAIEERIAAVMAEGLGSHLQALTGLFGSIMLELTGTETQQAAVAQWVGAGGHGCFMMTDRGGPALSQWFSTLTQQDDVWTVGVDKILVTGGTDFDFAIVIAARAGAMAPSSLLIPPDLARGLTREPVGLPYFDGQVQLADCRGSVTGTADLALARGGLIAVKQFLTVVRPRLVRAIMAHLDWLSAEQRLLYRDDHRAAAACLCATAQAMAKEGSLTAQSEDDVMALKFASNALLLDIVGQGCCADPMDARDLLAMTKMEGSSWRCFYEIYSRGKMQRNG